MKVSDVMTRATVTDTPDDTLADAASKMWEQQTGSLLVLEDDKVIGIFTERDLLKAIARGQDPKLVQVKDAMTGEVTTIAPDRKLREAAAIMASKWIRHLPVVEDDRVVGVISQRDLVGVFAQGLEEPETLERLSEGKLVRTRRLIRIEAGDLD